MMMHALIAGGMDAIYDPQIDESRKSYIRHDYNPNPNGYYESSVSIIDMLEDYDGKLIKIFGEHLINSRQVVDCGMRIVYMRRDPDEIALSKALMNGRPDKVKPVSKAKHQGNYVKFLRNRRDVELQEFWYQEVLREPEWHFERLREAGYPIDVEKCVATINPDYCHTGGRL